MPVSRVRKSTHRYTRWKTSRRRTELAPRSERPVRPDVGPTTAVRILQLGGGAPLTEIQMAKAVARHIHPRSRRNG